MSSQPRHPTTLLIGHGTRDAAGAREALDFAERLADHLRSLHGPGGPVVPCFLFTGVLVRRIARIVAEVGAAYPSVQFSVAEHLGCHPRLLDLVVRRIEQAHGDEVRMSCDRCKWRVPLVGFAHQVGQPQRSDRAHGLREDMDDGRHGHSHTHR